MELRYQNTICHLASMHNKEKALNPPFQKTLGCTIVPIQINTDLLGTFTGEIPRDLNPTQCAKQKCYKGLEVVRGRLGIASEGSFGPHPLFPFVPADFEVLVFVDKDLEFELTLTKTSPQTNFSTKIIHSIEELSIFAEKALFPSHGLILHPLDRKDPDLLFKGIQDLETLYNAFKRCIETAKDGLVYVETDMRAHMNPTRMKVLEDLAYDMSSRLATCCPSCKLPGWGVVENIQGLPCKECQSPTHLMKSKIYGCCQCKYQEELDHQKEQADPSYCLFCNP